MLARLKWRKQGLALLLGAAVLIVGGVGVASAVRGHSAASPLTAAQLKEKVRDPSYEVKAAGLATTTPVHAFTLADGQNVSVASNGAEKCILLQSGEDRCGEAPEVAEGHTIEVLDECGSSEDNRMEITGLAPEGATSVRLVYSDGSSRTTEVADGAFRFDATNPAAGSPYPTSVQWVGSSAALPATASLPVSGGNFCPGG